MDSLDIHSDKGWLRKDAQFRMMQMTSASTASRMASEPTMKHFIVYHQTARRTTQSTFLEYPRGNLEQLLPPARFLDTGNDELQALIDAEERDRKREMANRVRVR